MTFVLYTEKQYKAALRLQEMYKGMRVRAKAHLKDLDGMIKDSSARTDRYEKAHQSDQEGQSA
jgi:hypothetical protein